MNIDGRRTPGWEDAKKWAARVRPRREPKQNDDFPSYSPEYRIHTHTQLSIVGGGGKGGGGGGEVWEYVMRPSPFTFDFTSSE